MPGKSLFFRNYVVGREIMNELAGLFRGQGNYRGQIFPAVTTL